MARRGMHLESAWTPSTRETHSCSEDLQ
ncbi:UNVERIFIED_CONTAM: hypothetical protein GTU68_064233 [Idotea baltica]|nr:hypothetical protein [Idotea baltica]